MPDAPHLMLIDDTVDISAYLAEPEAQQVVRPAGDWLDRVIRSFAMPEDARGIRLPWPELARKLRIRHSELTLWPGINGHGKSLLLSQVMLGAMAQGERCLIASMEMRPEVTLKRMTRQATRKRDPLEAEIRDFHSWATNRLWLYDHLGAVAWRKLIGVLRWACSELEIKQIVIDSLMRCGVGEGDYDGQKDFVDALVSLKHDHDCSIHLVMHSRKRDDEMTPPGKFDAKGTGTMTDLADNVVTVWRNKRKEAKQAKGDDCHHEPDALLICDKQRNGEWEGRFSLWYSPDSMQFVRGAEGHYALPIDLMEFGA